MDMDKLASENKIFPVRMRVSRNRSTKTMEIVYGNDLILFHEKNISKLIFMLSKFLVEDGKDGKNEILITWEDF